MKQKRSEPGNFFNTNKHLLITHYILQIQKGLTILLDIKSVNTRIKLKTIMTKTPWCQYALIQTVNTFKNFLQSTVAKNMILTLHLNFNERAVADLWRETWYSVGKSVTAMPNK